MPKARTLNQQADKVAQRQLEVYKDLTDNEYKSLSDNAQRLAEHDLIMSVSMYQMALDKLRQKITNLKATPTEPTITTT